MRCCMQMAWTTDDNDVQFKQHNSDKQNSQPDFSRLCRNFQHIRSITFNLLGRQFHERALILHMNLNRMYKT